LPYLSISLSVDEEEESVSSSLFACSLACTREREVVPVTDHTDRLKGSLELLLGVARRHAETSAGAEQGGGREANHHDGELNGRRGREMSTVFLYQMNREDELEGRLTFSSSAAREKPAILAGWNSMSGMTGESSLPMTRKPISFSF
jgi:hypothetical protein